MTEVHKDGDGDGDGGACPYPVRDYDNATVGPVLTAANGIDALRAKHPFVRSTFGNGFWTFTNAEMIREALQHPDVFSSRWWPCRTPILRTGGSPRCSIPRSTRRGASCCRPTSPPRRWSGSRARSGSAAFAH